MNMQILNKCISLKKVSFLTDKATILLTINKYSFLMSKVCNKLLVKKIFEHTFNIRIMKINTLKLRKKRQNCSHNVYHKIILTLKKNDTINLFTKITF
jgi:large subunit ribosomal protein L23